jgi:hypothetical protein
LVSNKSDKTFRIRNCIIVLTLSHGGAYEKVLKDIPMAGRMSDHMAWNGIRRASDKSMAYDQSG